MQTFIFPTVKRITSHFRTKQRPNHHGVDFAEKGVHFIKAVADGVVTRSDVSQSYGEVVYIEHKINGQVYESVYAHMQKHSRRVSVGQKVKQSQSIGIMGNTGDSSGQHLHFELHTGKWNANKTNAVNPIDYLGKDLSPKPEKKVEMPTKIYTIKRGDNLTKIANNHKTNIATILKMNTSIKNPNIIVAGKTLKLPK